jgi:hypothetical protein
MDALPFISHATMAGGELRNFRMLGKRIVEIWVSVKWCKVTPKGDMRFYLEVLLWKEQHQIFM